MKMKDNKENPENYIVISGFLFYIIIIVIFFFVPYKLL